MGLPKGQRPDVVTGTCSYFAEQMKTEEIWEKTSASLQFFSCFSSAAVVRQYQEEEEEALVTGLGKLL